MNPMKPFEDAAEKIDRAEDNMVGQMFHAIVHIHGAIISLNSGKEGLPPTHFAAITESIESLKRESRYLERLVRIINDEEERASREEKKNFAE